MFNFGQGLIINSSLGNIMNEEFKNKGFLVLRNFYDVKNHTKNIPDLFPYIQSIKTQGEMDEQCPFAPSFPNQSEMDKIQIKVLSKLEEVSGLKLYPTYNYMRIYNKKSILKKHKDRSACEISITLTIGYEGDYNWPVFIEDKQGNEHKLELEPGDALLYKGCEQIHWREDADERVKEHCQVFIHYVDQNGPYSDCIYDKRRVPLVKK